MVFGFACAAAMSAFSAGDSFDMFVFYDFELSRPSNFSFRPIESSVEDVTASIRAHSTMTRCAVLAVRNATVVQSPQLLEIE